MKYLPEIVEKICVNIRAGKGRVFSVKDIINYDTFCEWMKNHTEFSEAIKKAEEEGNQARRGLAIACVTGAFNKHWQSAAWWLERTDPENFALRQKVDVTGTLKMVKLDV